MFIRGLNCLFLVFLCNIALGQQRSEVNLRIHLTDIQGITYSKNLMERTAVPANPGPELQLLNKDLSAITTYTFPWTGKVSVPDLIKNSAEKRSPAEWSGTPDNQARNKAAESGTVQQLLVYEVIPR